MVGLPVMSRSVPPLIAVVSTMTVVFGLIAAARSQPVRRGSEPICAIDMGSNTFRRIVGSFENGNYVQHDIEKKTMGVGDDVAQHGRVSETKLAEIREVLSAFKASCVKESATRIAAIGTAAFRDAANGARVIEIAAGAGVPMEIATEQRESELAYLVGSLGRDAYAIVDHGSRSIELVSKEAGTLRYAVSDLGYRVAYEKFFAPQNDPATAIGSYRDELRREASKAPFMKGKQRLVGVEFGDMIDVLFGRGATEGRILTLKELHDRVNQITAAGASGFAALKKTPDIDRALPRLVAAEFLTGELGYSSLELTERELGTGLIIEAGAK